MFSLSVVREIELGDVDESRFVDALMHFSFLTGYSVRDYKMNQGVKVLGSGTVMSLNPNSLKHTIAVENSDGRVKLIAKARVFPWEKSKAGEIMSHRMTQLVSYLSSLGMVKAGVSEEEAACDVVKSPFTHLGEKNIFFYCTSILKVALSMLFGVIGAICVMWVYGMMIIKVTDSRLMLEVTAGQTVSGGSIIGIASGYMIGMLLSIYFALSEVSEFLNRRILSFGIFFAMLLSFFIIEEDIFLLTALPAFSLPFFSYASYYLIYGVKNVYLKDD
ncbi:hypothetical protein ACFL2A_06250 [Thermodesulfobacteriota bacterium]